MSSPYNDIDGRTEKLKKIVLLMLNRLRLKATVISDKQLEKQVKSAFDALYNSVLKQYFESVAQTYSAVTKDDLNKWLEEYYIVTEYVFKNEWDRKAERYLEALLAMKASEFSLSGSKSAELQRKTSKLLSKQIEEYGIFVVDKARNLKFEDDGIKRIKWIAQKDRKTCAVCRARDNKIYDIDNAPAKEHYGCRCYYVPVGGETA